MPKALIFAVALLFSAVSSFSQDDVLYKPFKVDVSVGLGIPSGSGAKAGGIFAVEPKYAVIPNLALGLRFEAAIFARASITNANGNADEFEVKGSGSYVATGDYYFTSSHGFRPFAGGGLGLFQLASATTSSDEVSKGGTHFGQLVRGGFEAGHFRLGVEYNFVPSTSGFTLNSSGNTVTSTVRNNYWGFKLGVVFGGGQRD